MAIEQFDRSGTGPGPGPGRGDTRWERVPLPPLDFRDLLGAIRRRKWWIIGPTVVITGLAMAIVNSITPQFESTSSVLVDVDDRKDATLGTMLTGLPAGTETIQSQTAILLSRDFAARVIQELGLYDEPEFNPALRQQSFGDEVIAAIKGVVSALASPFRNPPPASVSSVEEQADRERVRIINVLLSKVKVLPQPSSWVIDITVTSESPVQAARIANEMASLYLVDQLEAKYESTKRTADWLTQRLADLRADVERSEGAVEAYRSTAGLLQAGGDTTLAQQQISTVNTQLVTIRARRAELEARLRQAETLLFSPVGAAAASDVLQSPLVQNLLAQEATVTRKVADLAASVGENHPELIRARAEEADLTARIKVEISKVVSGLRSEVAVVRAEESSTEQSLAQLEATVSSLNSKGAELRVLEREAETNQLLYDTFLSRFKETEDQEAIQQSDARIISRADVPVRPASPNKPILIALSTVFALLLGFFVVLLREQMERGLRSAEEVHRFLRQSCLGLVPTISRLRLRGQSPEDYVLKHPLSAVAEAIRTVRTGVLLSDRETRANVVVVTSARPNEGKTALSISMARLNAVGGRRTILLDLDLRKPEVHRRVKPAHERGVIDYLTGQAALSEVIQREPESGLEYVVAGRRVGNFAELLRSSHLEELFGELSRTYDLVVLDASPVLAIADTRLIARFAGKTLFVVRWNSTSRHVVRLALHQLVDAGADLAGVALTLVDIRRNRKYSFSDSESFTGAYKRYYTG